MARVKVRIRVRVRLGYVGTDSTDVPRIVALPPAILLAIRCKSFLAVVCLR